jgi:hypothetical protein
MWDPRIGKRNVGRQQICWADSLKRIAEAQWTTRARDRHVRRDLEKVFSEWTCVTMWINMRMKKKMTYHYIARV